MEKIKIYHETLDKLRAAQELIRDGMLALNELIGDYEASDELARWKRSKFTMFRSDSPAPGIASAEPTPTCINADIEKEKPAEGQGNSGILKFTEQEIVKMPKEFRKLFRAGKIVAHVRKRPNGVYEIRCQINHCPICASSKKLEVAKQKFIDALGGIDIAKFGNIADNIKMNYVKQSITLGGYMRRWLESKKATIKEETWDEYFRSFEKDIEPVFGKRPLRSIMQYELQEFLNSYKIQEKHRTAKKLYQLLSPMFEAAVNDDIIKRSPIIGVTLTPYEPDEGVPLSRAEEKELVQALKNDGSNVHFQALVFLVYTGIRPVELASVVVENGWVSVIMGKRRKGLKEKRRELPISPMLEPLLYLIDLDEITKLKPELISKRLKKLFPHHHLKETRHTFITRAQECKIPRELVSFWAGHKADSSMTSTVYTHFSQCKELQIEEMKKYHYKL